MRRSLRILLAACAIAAASERAKRHNMVSASPKEYPSIAEVRSAWEQRERATSRVAIAWSQKSFFPKGAITNRISVITGDGGKAVPYEDTEIPGTVRLLIDGRKMRFRYQDMEWDDPSRAFQKTDTDIVFDGEINTRLTRSAALPYHSATINKSRGAAGYDIAVWPAIASFRGTDPSAMNDLDLDIFTAARPVTVDARSLVELSRERDESRGEAKMWVDPGQTHAISRYEEYARDGNIQRRIVIVQERQANGLWTPRSWTILIYHKSKLFRTITATVTELIVSPPQTADEFQLALPPGTKVVNTTGLGPKEYIVHDNHTPREILVGEHRASHEDLMRTDTGELLPGGRPSYWSRNWKWLATILTCCMVIAALSWLIYRRRIIPSATH